MLTGSKYMTTCIHGLGPFHFYPAGVGSDLTLARPNFTLAVSDTGRSDLAALSYRRYIGDSKLSPNSVFL